MAFFVQLQAKQEAYGCFLVYWYSQGDLSAAIAFALADANDDPELADVFLSLVTLDDRKRAPKKYQATDTKGLFRYESRILWEPEANERNFAFPVGIIPANGGGPHDPSEIVEGFLLGGEPEYYWTHAVVNGRRFSAVLKSCFEWLAEPDGLEVRLLDHWEDAKKTEIWVRDTPPYWQFVEDHARDVIDNGFVEFAFYSRSKGVILRCTEHKTIVRTSSDATPCQDFMQELERMGLAAVEPLRSLAANFHHYHYRHLDGLDRSSLRQLLVDSSFRKAHEIEAT